jgi:CheY-like chemotaxis protein
MMVKNCLKGVTGFEFEIDEADSGGVAFEKCKPGLHQLVLMDIHMPGMDGYEATRLIRAWERTKGRNPIPIISVTAMDPAQAAVKTKDAGCNTFVSKPLKPAVLSEAIKKVLGVEVTAEGVAAPPPPKEAGGMFSKLFGGGPKKQEESVEQEGLKGMRSMFLAEKQREIGVALAAIDMGEIDTVTQIAYRLKGEGANYGFTKISEFGGTLAQAVEGRDLKTARNVTQKLMAYLGRAIELGSAA